MLAVLSEMLWGVSGRTMLWRCKTWLSWGWLSYGASETLPIVGINLVGANWKAEKGNASAYVLAVAADAGWGTKPSQVSANLSLGRFVSWTAVWKMLVSAMWPVFTWVTPPSSGASRVQRLLQNGTLIQGFCWSHWGLSLSPVLRAFLSEQAGVSYLEPCWELRGLLVYLLLLF